MRTKLSHTRVLGTKWMLHLVGDSAIEIRDDGQLVATEVYSESGLLLSLILPEGRSYHRQADYTWLANDGQRMKELHTDGPEETGYGYAVYRVAGW